MCSFRADRVLVEEFKAVCRERRLTVCHVFDCFMRAFKERVRVGESFSEQSLVLQMNKMVVVMPFVFNLTQHFHGKPRSRYKKLVSEAVVIPLAEKLVWPPNCELADNFVKSTKEVGCLEVKDWVPLRECWRCYRQRHPVG